MCLKSIGPNSASGQGFHHGEQRCADVCLVDSLRAHRYKVPYSSNGPFWALKDGNYFLRPWQSLGDFDLYASAWLVII